MTVADFVNEVVEHPSWAALDMKVGWFGDTLDCVDFVQEGHALIMLADEPDDDDGDDPDDGLDEDDSGDDSDDSDDDDGNVDDEDDR